MLLIIILGLMANLSLVCGECDVGTWGVSNFDWNKHSADRIWYWREHYPNPAENNLDCVSSMYGRPKGNRSVIIVNAYNISTNSYVTINGNATNWNDNGYWELSFPSMDIWSGRLYLTAIDYDSYFISKFCPFNSNKTVGYVVYRRRHPDEATVERVKQEMQNNNMGASQLVDWPANHCKQG